MRLELKRIEFLNTYSVEVREVERGFYSIAIHKKNMMVDVIPKDGRHGKTLGEIVEIVKSIGNL